MISELRLVPARLWCAFIVLWAVSGAVVAADFEQPTVGLAELVPAELAAGSHHVLAETVTFESNCASFEIRSAHGPLRAPGLELLALRVSELPAIDALTRINKSEAFVDALGKAAKAPLDFVGNLLSDPGTTIGNVASGIGQVIGKAGNIVRSGVESVADSASDIVSSPSHAGQDSPAAAADEAEPPAYAGDPFGYNKARRQWAKTLKVDPYTSNPVLRKLLDEAASATFAGSFAVDTTLGIVAAPVKFAVGFDAESRDAVWDLSPGDIELRNEGRLKAMSIEGRPVRDFFRNRWFTPTLQTALVDALERLDGVKGRSGVIDVAIGTRGELAVRGLVANLNLLADSHRNKALNSIRVAGSAVLGQTRQGEGVAAMSGDYFYWNKDTAAVTGLPAAHPDLLGGSRSLLGPVRISVRARGELERAGWAIPAAEASRKL